MKPVNHNKEFWITNISKRDVSLADLNITIKAGQSLDLLHRRNSFTKEELLLSAASGSLFTKRSKVFVRKVLPEPAPSKIMEMDPKATIPTRYRSILEVSTVTFDELTLSDDDFATQAADFVDHETYKR